MKRLMIAMVGFLVASSGFAQAPSPLKIVTDQVAAYNAKDINAFCNYYNDSIQYHSIADDFQLAFLLTVRRS